MNGRDLRSLQSGLAKASFYLGLAATAIGALIWANRALGGRHR